MACGTGGCGVIEAPPPVEQTKAEGDLGQKVAKSYLRLLGRPDDFHACKAVHLFDNRYRVNLWQTVGRGLVTVLSITDSAFVLADKDGNIQTKINKRY